MDKQILRKYINEYKINFEQVNNKEIYKWKAVKHFQDHWDIESPDFYKMLLESVNDTKNLLKSGQYFPLRMLHHYAKQKPKELRLLFKNLYDEEIDIYQRIKDFQKGIEEINNDLYFGKNHIKTIEQLLFT